MPPSTLRVSVLLLLPNAVACVAIAQNGATTTANANPATGRGIAAGRSAPSPSRNTTGNLPKTRHFRQSHSRHLSEPVNQRTVGVPMVRPSTVRMAHTPPGGPKSETERS